MPVPKRKRSRTRRDSRFANKGMVAGQFFECAQCKTVISSHQACRGCGFYKGKKIMTTKADRALVRSAVRKQRTDRTQKNASQVSSDQE